MFHSYQSYKTSTGNTYSKIVHVVCVACGLSMYYIAIKYCLITDSDCLELLVLFAVLDGVQQS
jgi:hypothetical protein